MKAEAGLCVLTLAWAACGDATQPASNQLAFISEPTDVVAGATFAPAIRVEIRDAIGYRLPGAEPAVTVSLGANPGGAVLAGTTTRSAVSGVATFSDVRLAKAAAGYTLLATATSLAPATSVPFAVSPGAAAQLGFVAQPDTAEGQVPFSRAVQVPIEHAYGNVVTDAAADVTVALFANPSGAALSGTATVRAGNGVAKFDALRVALPGDGFVLQASSVGLSSAPSARFSVRITLVQQDAGGLHTCAVTIAGFAYCWGNNVLGQLGDSTTVQRATPTSVAGGLSFGQVSARIHTCGVTTGNVVYCWGRDVEGQLGDGSPTYHRDSPTRVAGNVSFALISTGDFHTCGLTTGREAYCWGEGWSPTPAPISGALSFAQLDAGSHDTCGVTSGNLAYCWGDNVYGQLGDGTTTARAMPTLVTGGLSFALLTAGNVHTCGVTTAKVAYCWGYNSYGGLGDGTTQHRFAPVRVVQ